MTYFNFTKITPPSPLDPLVDEAAQLNANWDHLDSKLTPYINGTTPTGMQTGQEQFAGDLSNAVWDGAALRASDDTDAAWSAWTNLPLLSPRTARSGQLPKWRNNSLLRKVQVRGGFTIDGAASAWVLGTIYTVNGDVSGAIPASMTPIGGVHYQPLPGAQAVSPAVVGGGYCTVDKPGGNTFTRIRVQYMGGGGGGNFCQLDQLWWWY